MGTGNNYEIGYETLLSDFKRYQKQTPKGVSLQNKRNKTIILKFKVNGRDKSKGCNCTFTLDGMVDALKKSNKVAEALKSFTSETEFWSWYDEEILDKNKITNDLITFAEAIAKVEDDFWSRPDRRRRDRSKDNPSDQSSWHDTYGRFYRHLSQDKNANLPDIQNVIEKWKKGTKTYKGAVCAMKRLLRYTKNQDIINALNELDVTQTKYKDLQAITLKDFLNWRDETLGITASLHPSVQLDVRKAWLWVFSVQVVYGLRIHEVFAIKNLTEPYKAKDGVIIPALNNPDNTDNLIVITGLTEINTTTKTGYRIARPIIPPKYPDLLERLEIKIPLLPINRPKSTSFDTIRKFYCNKATEQLRRWEAPTTATHALRHLANINGMQAGIPLEIRAQSMGHTPAMNDSVYKKRQSTQTTIDLLLNSNQSAIDFVTALAEAKKLVKENESDKEIIARLLSIIYQKNEKDINKLL
jgi:integrase